MTRFVTVLCLCFAFEQLIWGVAIPALLADDQAKKGLDESTLNELFDKAANFDDVMKAHGYGVPATGTCIQNCVRFGAAENAVRYKKGDDFDRAEIDKKSIAHRKEIRSTPFRHTYKYEAIDTTRVADRTLLIGFNTMMRLEFYTHREDIIVRRGFIRDAYSNHVDPNSHWFLTKDDKLRACANRQEHAAVVEAGGIIYFPATPQSQVVLNVTDEFDVLKQLARNQDQYSVDVVVDDLRYEKPAHWGFYREKIWREQFFDAGHIDHWWLIGLWAKESPVPYFCTAGVLGVVDEKDSRVPDTLRANIVAIRVRDSQSKVVASYVPNATGITQKIANIGTAPIRGGKIATGTRNDDDPKKNASNLNAVGKNAGETREDNGLKMKLAWCPAGQFKMSSPKSESDRDEDQVDVTLSSGFWLGQTEVTKGQFQSVLGLAPWKRCFKEGPDYAELCVTNHEGPDFAASCVSHDDAVSFCVKLTTQEIAAGRLPSDWEYRLPSEAEWEYACRAGTKTAFGFGENATQLSTYAWWGGLYDGNAKTERYPHQVGLKQANAWGLKDMHGNVSEWCGDWYGEKLAGGTNPRGPAGSSFRVLRGGSWSDPPQLCRSANRSWLEPEYRNGSLGFRVLRSSVK